MQKGLKSGVVKTKMKIVAKRAAKKGPMKFGAKKQTQADPDLFQRNSHEKNNVETPAKLTGKAKLIFDIYSQDEQLKQVFIGDNF